VSAAEAAIERLDWRDAAEIAALLNSTWEAAYGPTAHPHFDAAYLTWLYGGPAAAEHLLVGRRINGRLVAFKALLARPVLLHGRPRSAHLGTHLTVHPGLSLGDRLTTVAALVRPQSLVPDGRLWSEPVDLSLAFYEAGKHIVRDSAAVVERFGLVRSEIPFQQAIVNPGRLAAALDALPPGRRASRPATAEDMAAIESLFQTTARSVPLSSALSGELLRHHFFGLAASHVHLVEEDGEPIGAILFYLMDTERLGRRSRVVVVEFLLAQSPETVVRLLAQALEYAGEHGAKGVVIENATYLDQETLRESGVVPSTRGMLLALVSRQRSPSGPAFLGDVK
jgi:hypothetical protein